MLLKELLILHGMRPSLPIIPSYDQTATESGNYFCKCSCDHRQHVNKKALRNSQFAKRNLQFIAPHISYHNDENVTRAML